MGDVPPKLNLVERRGTKKYDLDGVVFCYAGWNEELQSDKIFAENFFQSLRA